MSGLLLFRRPLRTRWLLLRPPQVRRYALIGKPKQQAEPVWALPRAPARTRFAPSPTGYLHLGSLRTALYNYLLAQATGGQFVIRLEDTDRARFVADSESRLYDDLAWAGLQWNEGPDKGGPFGPYKQSERLGLYTQHAHSLLEEDHAFRCFCKKEDLEFNLMQATASGGTAHYPGTCMGIEKSESDRRAANGEPHTIRFKSAEIPVSAPDLVYGAYKKNEREDNFIIMKSDGYPTYHFANVVDDHFMKITHVIRGAEWLISTPKHVELYNAFGWQPPNFAHVGLLVDLQRQKLSKRDIDNIGIQVYRDANVMPEALLNFSALLGWDPNLQKNPHLNKQGVLTLDDMKKNFSLKFTRGDIAVDLTKLKFFQTKITRGLVSGEINDPQALSRRIVKPIQAELRNIEDKLSRYLRDKTLFEGDERRLIQSLGNSGPHPDALTDEYIQAVLKSWKGTVEDPVQFVHDNIHVFHRFSTSVLRQEFFALQKNKARIVVERGKDLGLENTDISMVFQHFRTSLKRHHDSNLGWDTENLGPSVKDIVSRVRYYDTTEQQAKDQSAGWEFLRWALLNGRSGMSIVPLMVLWGPDETLRRLRQARKAAKLGETELKEQAKKAAGDLERAPMKAAKKSGKQRGKLRRELKRAGLIRMPTDAEVEAGSLSIADERDGQPSGAKNEAIGSFPPFHRLLLHTDSETKGPFASRPPTPSPKSPPRSPQEVQRPPTFLNFKEWKSSTRHLDLGNHPDQGVGDSRAELESSSVSPASLDRQSESQRTPGLASPSADLPAHRGAPPVMPEGRGPFAIGEPLPDLPEHVKVRTAQPSRTRGPFAAGPPIRNRAEHLRQVMLSNRKTKCIEDASPKGREEAETVEQQHNGSARRPQDSAAQGPAEGQVKST